MSRLFACAAAGLLLFGTPGQGQPPGLRKGEKLAPFVAPSIYRATAAEEKGEVLVRVTWRSLRIAAEVDGKRTRGWVYVWEKVRPLTLGKEVQAYGRDGKPLSKEAVVKALARPASVACFVRAEGDPEKPDPLYLEVLRDGAVVLVFKSEDTRR